MSVQEDGAKASPATEKVRVWDWTVRTVHWSMMALIGVLWWTAEEGHMEWHTRIGLILLGVLVFRFYWGFAGPETARFSKLFCTPGTLLTYLKRLLQRPYVPHMGHNPLGSFSVIALFGAVTAVVGFGLFSSDVNGFFSGPLANGLSFSAARDMADRHETAFNILLALIVLHVIAIAAYTLGLRANLIGPMLTGVRTQTPKDKAEDAAAAKETPEISAPWVRVAIGIALAVGAVYALVTFGP